MTQKLSKTTWSVYGGRLKDVSTLKASSSGGAFTALSDVFLKKRGAVVCSSYNFETHQQEFKIITSEEERNKARGSKYVQSIPGNIFKDAEMWLKEHPDKELLFVGTGCQSAGFLYYAEVRGFIARITVADIICHGSPSPELWKDYIRHLESRHGNIESLAFKDKRRGWRTPVAAVSAKGGEYFLNDYVRVFYSDLALRPSCYKCPYASIARSSDITIGDFWHIDEKRPEQYDNLGTSLFLIHTEKGQKLFKDASESLHWFESNEEECWQANLEHPTARPKGRDVFWNDYHSKGLDYVLKKYSRVRFRDKVKRKLMKFVKKQ